MQFPTKKKQVCFRETKRVVWCFREGKMSTGSVVDPHDEMRARDTSKVARGEQAPRAAHELGSISQAPPPPPHLPIKVEEMRTAPADSRFPSTNQTRHCYTRYIEYHRCRQKKSDEDCEKFAKYYRALCPTDWIVKWNEQRERGIFPGPL